MILGRRANMPDFTAAAFSEDTDISFAGKTLLFFQKWISNTSSTLSKKTIADGIVYGQFVQVGGTNWTGGQPILLVSTVKLVLPVTYQRDVFKHDIL